MPITTRQIISQEINRLEEIEADTLADRIGLPEWGHWARSHDLGLGYSKPPVVFRARGTDAPGDLRRVIARIPDERALVIDAAIGRLGHPYRAALERVYLEQQSYRRLPRYWQRQHMVAVGMLAVLLDGAHG